MANELRTEVEQVKQQELLAELNAAPDRVLFPKTNAR